MSSTPSIQLEDEEELFDTDFTADENKVEGKASLVSSALNMANSAIGGTYPLPLHTFKSICNFICEKTISFFRGI